MEYPKDQLEFEDRFRTETECIDFFKQIRWPKGFLCRRCDHTEAWEQSRGRFTCKSCRFQSSLNSGTMFEGSRLKLRLWYRAIWWVVNQKHGTSASGLQKGLGIKSYRTAWLLLHKIRTAMVDPRRSQLHGNIEIDEAYVGGKKQGASLGKTGTKGNPMVIVAVEFDQKRLGRIRIEKSHSNTTTDIFKFVAPNIAKGSHLYSDKWAGYLKFKDFGYKLSQSASVKGLKNGEDVLPRVHLVISLLKNWLNGTHHGRVGKQHLQVYLDEFVFRFNRRNSTSRGLLFKRVLENAIFESGPTFKKLTTKSK